MDDKQNSPQLKKEYNKPNLQSLGMFHALTQQNRNNYNIYDAANYVDYGSDDPYARRI